MSTILGERPLPRPAAASLPPLASAFEVEPHTLELSPFQIWSQYALVIQIVCGVVAIGCLVHVLVHRVWRRRLGAEFNPPSTPVRIGLAKKKD